MTNLESIVLNHVKKYPKMQPQDAVKLLYQHTFGGGHLIADEKKCREYYDAEVLSVNCTNGENLCEDIGNGLARANLRAIDTKEKQNKLFEIFLRSAREKYGDIEKFKENLTLLTKMTEKGQMPFSEEDLNKYLEEYAKAGYPMVSHSEIYKKNYQPAYRVVKIKLLEEIYDL